jgi:predicted metal-dependent hydrolase
MDNELQLLPIDLHPDAKIGINLFNQREYFNAHEALEKAWREEQGPTRNLYRGILQVAVAYFHIQRFNYLGARKMLLRCRQWLAPFPRTCLGINLEQFTEDYLKVEASLISLGEKDINLFDFSLLKPIPLITQK